MKPYYQDKHISVFNKSCLNMTELNDNSIQCVVTSPPYWGMRKYAGVQDIPGWGCAYGCEPTPKMYIQHTVEILKEIRRVLRKDGVVFWNIGDSYMSSPSNQQPGVGQRYKAVASRGKRIPSGSIKTKDLCLIPFRVAIAAQEDGWWVRAIIIWSKPNSLPESVKDRPTKSHEYILMLTKSARYYWDADAAREPAQDWGTRDRSNFRGGTTDPLLKHHGLTDCNNAETGRNVRSVWEFPTQPFQNDFKRDDGLQHFAVFPAKLPEICIKAASKEGDTVLDPFSGTGTTLWVAKKLNRKAIGFDISEGYCRLAVDRNRQQVIF